MRVGCRAEGLVVLNQDVYLRSVEFYLRRPLRKVGQGRGRRVPGREGRSSVVVVQMVVEEIDMMIVVVMMRWAGWEWESIFFVLKRRFVVGAGVWCM